MKKKAVIIFCGLLVVAGLAAIALPLLARPSNCGGNSTALTACGSFSILARLAAIDGKAEFNFSDLDELDRIELAHWATNHWLCGAEFFVRTNFTITSARRVVIIVCAEPFSNVPQPTIWNLYRENPAHAVGYSDGSKGLISPVEYAALDLIGFIPASQVATNASFGK